MKKGNARDNLLHVGNVVELVQEPLVNLCELVNFIDSSTGMESVGDGKDSFVGRILELFVDILVVVVLQNKAKSEVRQRKRKNEGGETFPNPAKEGSIALIAFWIVSSKVFPIAITSPTLFMLLLKAVETRVNFFKSHRGILTTT